MAVCLTMVLAAGCGGGEQKISNRATVSGKVTFEGEPLPAGTITFASTERRVATPVPITGGDYSSTRVPLGSCEVTVDTAAIQFGNPAQYVAIPPRYNYPDQSGLTADIKADDNENVDFELTK